MKLIDVCRSFIALDSTPSHGNKEVAEFAGQLCKEAGLHVEFQRETLNGLEQLNVIARPSANKPQKEFLLQTHLDTVDPGSYANWTETQENPFNASIYEDFIFGLGTADTKLDFLCKLEAIRNLDYANFSLPFVLVGTFGAQNGMSGAIKLVRRKFVSAEKALIGEPTNLHIVHAGQGMLVVEISIPFSEEEREYRLKHDLIESSSSQSRIFNGKAAHSSVPGFGDNGIIKMLEYLSQLPEGIAVMDLDGGISYNSVPESAVLEIDMVGGFKDPIAPKIKFIMESLKKVEADFKNYCDEGFEPPFPTMNIGMIRTFDDQIRMTGSCRIPPKVPTEVYEQWMESINQSCNTQGASFRIRDYKQAYFTPTDSQFMQQCFATLEEVGVSAKPRKISVCTEASIFSRMGIECLLFGPGQGPGNSHAPNEKIKIEELKKAIDFYTSIIPKVCK